MKTPNVTRFSWVKSISEIECYLMEVTTPKSRRYYIRFTPHQKWKRISAHSPILA